MLPTAMPVLCNTLINKLPGHLGPCYALATSAVFRMPVMRHVWWYIDLRPASRQWFHRLLDQGYSVGLSPGGVREVVDMKPGLEVAYLTRRLGFIRIALKHGCASFLVRQLVRICTADMLMDMDQMLPPIRPFVAVQA